MPGASRRAPDGSLELEWVFGYNGHTARNNVKITKDGHIVYYVAGVGVVHDMANSKQNFFTGHNDDITSLNINAEGTMVATGQVGRDAYITVWDVSSPSSPSSETSSGASSASLPSCQPLSVIRDGHTHRVAALAFSTDGELLASVGGSDDKLTLMVWEWRKGRRVAQHIAFRGQVEEVEWEPGSVSKLVSCGRRHVKFWKLRGNALQATTGVFGGALLEDQVSLSHMSDGRVVTGGKEGNLYVWRNSKLERTVQGLHTGGVTVIEIFQGGLITGGTDGTITILDAELEKMATIPEAPSLVYEVAAPIHSLAVFNNKIVVGTEQNEVWIVGVHHDGEMSAQCLVQGHGTGEVWGLASHPSKRVVATASDDKTVRLWCLDERIPMATTVLDVEARSVGFAPDGFHLAVGLRDGSFTVLETEHLKEEFRVSDRKEVRHDLKYSPDGLLLAVASNDNFVDVYDVEDEYSHKWTLKGASSFIMHLDWSTDSCFISTNTGDGEQLFYNAQTGEHVVDGEVIRAMEWSSWTGVLGTEVAGLWHKYADLSDINAADANFYYNVIVTGDDYGLVKLFRFPCPKRGSKSRSFVGHSEHVTNVRWTSDSSDVVSVGGADHALFLWRFRPSRSMRSPKNEVSVKSLVEDSDEDGIDTEDEYEGIPELTLDLEEEKASSKKSRRRSKANSNDIPPDAGVELADDSTFAKRRNLAWDEGRTKTPPDHMLKIKHVFGYRSHECRNNVHWLCDGRIVHHVAGMGVVTDPKSRKQRHYLHHTDDILCLALHPDGDLVATGQMGRDASVHVWSACTVRIMAHLVGEHHRGVSALSFSGDGTKLASVGMDENHTVVLWNWKKGYKLANARGHKSTVFGVLFSPINNLRLVTYGVRHFKVWTQTGGGLVWRQAQLGVKLRLDTVLTCGVTTNEDGIECWLAGMSSGVVAVLKDGKLERSVKAHKGPVYAITATSQGVWTGGQDGYVCRWDSSFSKCLKVLPITDRFLSETSPVTLLSSQPGIRALSKMDGEDTPLLLGTQHAEILVMKEDGSFRIIMQGHGKGELWGLATHPRILEAVTVSDDRTLRRWDLEEFRALGMVYLRKAARCVAFRGDATCVAVGFLDGGVSLYTFPKLEKMGSAHHRQEAISDVQFSPDGRLLAVASHENYVDIFVVDSDGDTVASDASGLRRVGICRGSSSYITSVSWHTDSRLLQVNTGAGEQLFYEAPLGARQLIPEASESSLSWAMPLRCPLDVNLGGIWAPGMDLTDINAVATSFSQRLVVTASDNQGLVRLFRYPCPGPHKPFRQYPGHSSHVTNVQWSSDDEYVLTTGGADTAVIVWRVKDVKGQPSPSNDRPSFQPDDHPDEQDITIKDLEAAGLEFKEDKDEDEDEGIKLTENGHSRDGSGKRETKVTSKAKLRVSLPPRKLRALPVLDKDDSTLFYCSGTAVGKIVLNGGAEVVRGLGYADHDTEVTAIALASGEPVMMATAQLSGEEHPALVHVWRPSDGTTITLLQGGDEDVVTAISFSPGGRFLATLADATTLHVFNWIKGVHVAQAAIRGGLGIGMVHVGDTTIVIATGSGLFFYDLVGSTLVATRTQAPPGVIPESTTYTSVCTSPNGKVYAGCSDGTVIEFEGRTAVRWVSPPHEQSDSLPSSPLRLLIAADTGAIFTAHSESNTVIVRCYNSGEDKLAFKSDVSFTAPSSDWIPASLSLGSKKLVLGARRQQPFMLIDIRSGKTSVIDITKKRGR